MNCSWCVAILVFFSAVSCSPYYDTKGKETLDFASNKRDSDTHYDAALTLLSLHDQVRVEAAIRIRDIYSKGKAVVTQNQEEAWKWQKFDESIGNPKALSSPTLTKLPSFSQLIQRLPAQNRNPTFTQLPPFSQLVQSMKNVA